MMPKSVCTCATLKLQRANNWISKWEQIKMNLKSKWLENTRKMFSNIGHLWNGFQQENKQTNKQTNTIESIQVKEFLIYCFCDYKWVQLQWGHICIYVCHFVRWVFFHTIYTDLGFFSLYFAQIPLKLPDTQHHIASSVLSLESKWWYIKIFLLKSNVDLPYYRDMPLLFTCWQNENKHRARMP